MSDEVAALVAARLASSELDPFARAVVSAAFVGGDRLDEVLAGGDAADGADQPSAADAAGTPEGGVWLTGVSVEGFRGVAATLAITLPACPGLVLVVGRNGSGKSSLAEGAELAVVGSSDRSSSAVWRGGVVNLHHNGARAVSVSVSLDGGEDVSVGLDLTESGLDGATPWARRSGGDPFDLTGTGWAEAAVRYRPVLTYSELAALSTAEKQSALYDPLNLILGLQALTDADALLRAAFTRLDQARRGAGTERQTLVRDLGTVDGDERADRLKEALSPSKVDTVALRALLLEAAASPPPSAGAAAGWSGLTVPTEAAVTGASDALSDRLVARAEVASDATARALRLADLLDAAVAHRETPEDLCPVCGQGRLDEDWLVGARAEADRQRTLATDAAAAEQAVAAARTAAVRLVTMAPPELGRPPVGAADPAAASVAWDAWAALGKPDVTEQVLVDRLVPAAAALRTEVDALVAAARQVLEDQDRVWRPLAERATAVLSRLDHAADCAAPLAAVKAARAWLKTTSDAIRNDRLRPFAEQATAIWGELAQESNVTLSGVTLASQNTRRTVQLELDVDGVPGDRAVLSQGELAALGLALFLPRSVTAESPFRFVVVDDPVQSLDPSKVDGLARVLHGLAADRQVVVFTHDLRLLRSLKHLALPFTGYRLDRGERSVVTAELIVDPVLQHLADADALAKEGDLPADLLAVAVAGYCRDAIEDAALELARHRLFGDGRTVEDVEEEIEAANDTRARLALALVGKRRPSQGRLDKELARLTTPEVVRRCVDGVHVPDGTDLPGLLAATRSFVDALRATA